MAHEYAITDFTVISGWEALASDLEALLGRWGDDGCATILYKGVPLAVSLVSGVQRVRVLEGLPRFATDEREDGGYLARVFGAEQFVLVRCGDSAENWMSLGTARLVLSALAMAAAGGRKEGKEEKSRGGKGRWPAFVEYGEGNVIGVAPGSRFSLTIESCATTGDTIFRQLALRHFNGIPRKELSASYCVTLSTRPPHPPAPPRTEQDCRTSLPWGRRTTVLDSIEVQSIFPQVDPGLVIAGLLPEAMSAPVWMLSVNRTAEQPGALARIVDGFVALLRTAQQPMATGMEALHDKTRMHNLMHGAAGAGTVELMRLVLFGREGSLAQRIVRASLLAMLEDGVPSQRALFDSFGAFWRELVQVLREYWIELEPLSLTADEGKGSGGKGEGEKEGGGGSSEEPLPPSELEMRLAMLSYCIDRERAFLEIPNAPRRKNMEPAGGALDALAAKHSAGVQQRRREQLERIKSTGKALVHSIITTAGGAEQSSKPQHDNADDNDDKNGKQPKEDERFYDVVDAAEDADAREILELLRAADSNSSNSGGADPTERRGHRELHRDGLCLLETGEPMWIPYTQDYATAPPTAPYTQDYAIAPPTAHSHYHHQHYPADGDGEKRRQCAHLVSDMRAFKAANPGAVFADFVRWHSPRDYVDGALSVRMATPGNVWLELWGACGALSAVQQPLLFDWRREAEKVLFWLEDVAVVELLSAMLPTVLDVVAARVQELGGGCLRVPPTIDSEALRLFGDGLSFWEGRLTLRLQLAAVLPSDLEVQPLLDGDPILIAQEEHRQTVASLFERHAPSIEKELIITAGNNNDGQRRLYVRLIDGLVETGLSEPYGWGE